MAREDDKIGMRIDLLEVKFMKHWNYELLDLIFEDQKSNFEYQDQMWEIASGKCCQQQGLEIYWIILL